ncbi:MAG: RodZ domain-containing protein [Pseudomonadota bacterium]
MTKDSPSADDATGQAAALSRSEETLGSFLKRHRQNQGKDLEEIAKKTRIHASTLRAIEEDNPNALPAEVFTRGFVKNYARYLGVDPNEALAWYIEQNDGEARPTEKINVQEVLAGETMAEARTFPAGRFIAFFVVVGVLFFAGYLILSFLNSSAPPADIATKDKISRQALVEQQPPPAAPVIGEPGAESAESIAGDAGTEQAPSVTQSGTQDPALSLPGSVSVKPGQTLSLPEKSGQLAEPQKVEGEQGLGVKKKTDDGKPIIFPQAIKEKPGLQEVAKPAPVSPASVVAPTLSTVKAPGMNYVLEAKFTAPTWLSVQIDKEKKKSSIYQPGDHMVWQAEKKISLFVGNAGGIVLILNGKPVPPLGKLTDSKHISFPAE